MYIDKEISNYILKYLENMNAYKGHITPQFRHGNVRIIKNNWFLKIYM